MSIVLMGLGLTTRQPAVNILEAMAPGLFLLLSKLVIYLRLLPLVGGQMMGQ